MARPKLNIDPEQVLKLAAMGCLNREIAAVMNCDEDTIHNRFSEEIKKGRENGKTKLRRLMWQSAEKGNAVMQIWLSKNVLGWSDKVEQNVTQMTTLTMAKEFAEMPKEQLLKIVEEELKKAK